MIFIEAPGSHTSKVVSHLTLDMLQTDPNPSSPALPPLPSPRTKSIGPSTPVFKSLASAPELKPPSDTSKSLPRIMLTVCTFVPSLNDELSIRIGEPLMMMEEYEDEWCLVQRVGDGKGEIQRGVVPRFCLQDLPDNILPAIRKHVKAASE